MSEIPKLTEFFFKKGLKYDANLLIWKKAGKSATKKHLKTTLNIDSGTYTRYYLGRRPLKTLLQEAKEILNKIQISHF